MDAVSNVGVWVDKIYMGEKRRGGSGRRAVISLKHSGGHRERDGWHDII